MAYDRKYWGPYSPVPQDRSGGYVHTVYPMERRVILKHGKPHVMCAPELDEMHERWRLALVESMVVT